MRHMLDTNIVSHLFKRHPEVVSRMTCLAPGDVCISSITEAELLYGADKKKSSRLKETIREFLNTITICDWDSDAAATEALRHHMRSTRAPLSLFDYGPGVDALRSACEAETGLPAPIQPAWPELEAAQ